MPDLYAVLPLVFACGGLLLHSALPKVSCYHIVVGILL